MRKGRPPNFVIVCLCLLHSCFSLIGDVRVATPHNLHIFAICAMLVRSCYCYNLVSKNRTATINMT